MSVLPAEKFCPHCSVIKPRTAFAKRNRPNGRVNLQSHCRSCVQQQRNAPRLELIKLAKSKPCIDCGGTFPTAAMDLHHRDPDAKLFNLSSSIFGSKSLTEIQSEIRKCDVICANCHRIRHG